jgi:predicted RNase H-like HicB family nuclease
MVTTIKTTKSGAVALHNSSSCEGGDSHDVALLSLKVMITEEEGYWFAQCLEIDYAADGESVEDVTKRFEDGLEKAIDIHLHEFSSLDNLLKPAPSRVLMEFNGKFTKLYSQVSRHFTEGAEGTIQYYQAAA